MSNYSFEHQSLCSRVANTLYNDVRDFQLNDDPRLALYDSVDDHEPVKAWSNNFALHVAPDSPMFKIYGIDQVSVLIPMDAMGNRFTDGVNNYNLPTTIEIALVDRRTRQLSYSHPMVPDVARFISVDDLLDFLDELAWHTAVRD